MRKIPILCLAALSVAYPLLPAFADPQDDVAAARDLREDGHLVEAFDLFRAAAEQGDVDAQYEMGRSYASGLGVTQDMAKAHVWYDIAVMNGSTPAIFGRRNAFKALSEEDLAAARNLAKACIDSNYETCD